MYDGSELDEDATTTEAATTEDSVSDVSPGAGPNIEFGVSTGGLDFMSSSGYPQIEFGYDDVSDEEEDEEDDDESTNPDVQNPNGVGHKRPDLVSLVNALTLIPSPWLYMVMISDHVFPTGIMLSGLSSTIKLTNSRL